MSEPKVPSQSDKDKATELYEECKLFQKLISRGVVLWGPFK